MDKICLKRLTLDDAKEYVQLINEEKENSDVIKNTPGFFAKTCEEYIELLSDCNSRNHKMIAICRENKMIGAICMEHALYYNEYIVSYFIGKNYREKHYASRALALLIQKLQNTNIKKIHFFIDPQNQRAYNIISRNSELKYSHSFEGDDVFSLSV